MVHINHHMRTAVSSLGPALVIILLGNACSNTASQDRMSQLHKDQDLAILELKQRVSRLEIQGNEYKYKLALLEQTSIGAKDDKQEDKQEYQQQDGLRNQSQTAAQVKFDDLQDVATKDLIEDLAKLGVFAGIDHDFRPYQPISRAEYVTWLFKAYNILEPKSKQLREAPQLSPQFKDTPKSHPHYKFVQALANAGYAIGYKDGTFRPDKPLTREEMLGIKVGVDVGKTLDPWRSQMETVWKFSDCKDVDERFTGYINQDFYISGPHGSNVNRAFGKVGALKPKRPVLRSEAAATLWQIGQFGHTESTNAGALLGKQ